MKSVKYISDLIIHYIRLFSVCCVVFEKTCFGFFQSVKYWKIGSLEQWVNLVNIMARDVQTLPHFFYFPHKIASWKWKHLCRSHINNILHHQCGWDCIISGDDWRILSPLCPLLMKMLCHSRGTRVSDKVQSLRFGFAFGRAEGRKGPSRRWAGLCWSRYASHWKKGDDPGRWQCQITMWLSPR